MFCFTLKKKGKKQRKNKQIEIPMDPNLLENKASNPKYNLLSNLMSNLSF